MRVFYAVLLLSLLALGFSFGYLPFAMGQEVYAVDVQGFAWDHSSLTALLITSENESWWRGSYVDDAFRAIGQWNDAFTAFAANYTAYAYLSGVTVQSTVSNTSIPGYDLYINWTKSSLCNNSDEVGLAKTYVNSDNSIVNCTISLAVQTSQGTLMRGVDIQNIAMHELGHGFGLGHCNYPNDLMYSIYSLAASPKAVSTLDAYGVARCFAWIHCETGFHPVSNWLNMSIVSLPSDITYVGLPVSVQNQPPQTLTDNASIQFLLMMLTVIAQPIIAVPVLIVLLVLVILAAIPRRRHSTVRVDS
jgi:hypothetical protein